MELVGISEIAELAEVSRSAVSNWISRDPSFPQPIADLACGQIWQKADIERWLEQNKHLGRSAKKMDNGLIQGKVYTHDFICQMFGGDAKGGSYLVQTREGIVCGCFTGTMNPEAPECILIGNGPRIMAKAERMAQQGGSIPVFMKQGVNQWEYKGPYEFVRFSRDAADFETRAVLADRNDVAAALFFKKGSE